MTRGDWEKLSRKQQLRILRGMGGATVAGWFMTYLQLERLLNGFWDAAEKTRRDHA